MVTIWGIGQVTLTLYHISGSQRVLFCHSGDTWQCPEAFVIAMVRSGRCHWHLMGRDQGCY